MNELIKLTITSISLNWLSNGPGITSVSISTFISVSVSVSVTLVVDSVAVVSTWTNSIPVAEIRISILVKSMADQESNKISKNINPHSK